MSEELQSALDRLVGGAPEKFPPPPDDEALNASGVGVVRALVRPAAPPAALRTRLREDAADFAAGRSAPAKDAGVISLPRRRGPAAGANPWFPLRA